MRHKRNQFIPKAKRALLIATTIACGTVSSCGLSLRDIRHNVVAGTAGFVTAYTTSFWNTVIPGWDEILTPDE
jgi:hypothetical protein